VLVVGAGYSVGQSSRQKVSRPVTVSRASARGGRGVGVRDAGERVCLGLMAIAIKRVYEEPGAGDGYRVLVDRLWPRGMTKERARVDEWLRDVAPSTELRKEFGHDPGRFAEFTERYRAELDANPATDALRAIAEANDVLTLVYAAQDAEHNQAVVLRDYLVGHIHA
jgi:uncharacterized protein YeaO (DUF488 family)